MRNFWAGLIVFAVIIISLWIQINILNIIPLFSVTANIGIVLVVSLGILSGQTIGITVGIVYGILSDILFGKTIGVYILLYALTGFFCGKISGGFSKENKSSIIMVVAGATVVFEFACYLLLSVIYNYDFALVSTLWTIFLESIYNIFIARIFFKILSFIAEIINKGKRSYYLL